MTQDEVFTVVKKNIREVLYDLNTDEIPMEASLKDLGANSLDRADITVMCMEELELKIPMVEFGGLTNIQGLVELLTQKVNT
ncbi:acyl carrier protein [Chloroflexi bacterium TSY]|nr:acyl carrier protein [Chloroflexi bacterium TSY]